MNTQSTPGKIDCAQKQYQDTFIGDAQKHAQSIRDTVVKHLIDSDINTKVSHDTYRRYNYLDTAHLCAFVIYECGHWTVLWYQYRVAYISCFKTFSWLWAYFLGLYGV